MQANDLNMVIHHYPTCLSSLQADAQYNATIPDACCTRDTLHSTILQER
ncbi:MAG: hypothetical protein K5793_02025 [Nitrosarchaeum sp.]|nr:hypothetical protein [Nitrosarchaeum sp.]